MTAQPVDHAPSEFVERTPEGVRAALDDADRARFDTAWQAALDEARSTPSLAGLQHVIGTFWALASAKRSPRFAQATEDGRRWLAGEIRGIPAGQLFAELGLDVSADR